MGDSGSPNGREREPSDSESSPAPGSERARSPRGVNTRLAGLGMELAAAVAGACLLGYWLDRRFGTTPWWFIVCTVIGLVGGLYNLLRQAIQETSFGPPQVKPPQRKPDREVPPE